METWMFVLIWVVVIAAVGAGLYFWGKKLQKRYDEQQQLVNQHKQVVPLFIIDKKKDKIDNLKLPKQVKEQMPKMQRKRKMPVVIAKAGPQIVTLMCDEVVYNTVPVKKQIKAEVAGIMLVNVVSGKLPTPQKEGLMNKMKRKAKEIRNK
ncbi:MAG: hypothetical protein RR448_07220 [Niameybacter sp.]|uniref:hypothetical protein n=1 Tax=Niameybacter sp. TaxID=2033640 RepID=UPI002FC8967C